MKHKNTLQKGEARTLIFKQKDEWVGVALDFNIVEVGSDPREIIFALDEAIRGFVISARKARLRPSILNQKSEEKYEKLFKTLEDKKPVKSPYQVYSFGRQKIASI